MTAPATDAAPAPDAAPATGVPGSPVSTARRRGSDALFWFGMPVFLVLTWVLTYVVDHRIELDSIEARVLNFDTLRTSTVEHLQLSVVSTVIVIVVALPLGVLATRPFARRVVPAILGVANIGQGVPSYGLLAIFAILIATGFWPVVIGLVAYSALPILRNTMVGLQQVDRSLVKASRGMGMSALQVLLKVELPLAVPVMIAGIRTALIVNVGTATLATFFGAGGLGFVIFSGIGLNRNPVLYTGVVMAASLALLVDYLGKVAGRVLSPKGLGPS